MVVVAAAYRKLVLAEAIGQRVSPAVAESTDAAAKLERAGQE